MRIESLPSTVAEALAASPLSTRLRDVDGVVPPGHRRLVTARTLEGRDFEAIADDLLHWRMHAGAGLRVEASQRRAAAGAVVRLRAGLAAVGLGTRTWPGLTVVCRVVEVIDEEDAQGFAYATLVGHPESGVQRFVVTRHVDGRVRASVTSVSAPGRGLLRLAGPLAVWVQRLMAARYCSALDR